MTNTLFDIEMLLMNKVKLFCDELPGLINNDFSIYTWSYKKLSLHDKPDEWFIELIERRLEQFKKSKTREVEDVWMDWGAIVVDIAKIAVAWWVIRKVIKSDNKEWMEKELEEINKNELS